LVKLFPNSDEAKSVQAKLNAALQTRAAKPDSLSITIKGTNHADKMSTEKKDTTLALPNPKPATSRDSSKVR